MVAIKLNVLTRMDKAPPAVRICCIKFIQKVVLVQTPGLIADPRVRQYAISDEIVAHHTEIGTASGAERDFNHACSTKSSSTATAKLGSRSIRAVGQIIECVSGGFEVFPFAICSRHTANINSEPLMIDATMNCLGILIRTRQAVAN